MNMLDYALQSPGQMGGLNPFQMGQQIGGAIDGGIEAYKTGVEHTQEQKQKIALFAAQLKQHELETQKAQRGLALDSENALGEQMTQLYRAAKAGDEDAAKQLGGMLPRKTELHNQAHGLDLPIPKAPVGSPIFGAPKAPTAPTIPGGVVPPPSGLDGLSLDPTGVLSQSLGDSLPQETGRSFTNDKTLAYIGRNLLLPPGERLKINPGDTIGEWDPLTNAPKNLYTAPNPQAEARIVMAQQQLALATERLKDQTLNAQERLRLQGEATTAKTELAKAQLEAKQTGFDLRGDQRAAELRQKWGHDLATYVTQGRGQYIRDNTYVDEDKVKHAPKAADVAAEEARLEAYYRKNNPDPTGAADTPQGGLLPGGVVPKNPNPTRSLTTPGKPSGRNPFQATGSASSRDLDIGLAPQMQTAYNPGGVPLPRAGGVAHWAPYVQAASQQTGVPEQILEAVMRQESGGRADARSPVGALGLMQLMPGTAAGLHVNPSDPAQNILGGAKYLRQMYDKFGNWESALAAYNAGPGALAPSKQNAAYQIWQAPYNKGYAETRNYVSKIKADLRRMQKGGQFGALPAEMTDKMAEFYAKHGIQPGAADA